MAKKFDHITTELSNMLSHKDMPIAMGNVFVVWDIMAKAEKGSFPSCDLIRVTRVNASGDFIFDTGKGQNPHKSQFYSASRLAMLFSNVGLIDAAIGFAKIGAMASTKKKTITVSDKELLKSAHEKKANKKRLTNEEKRVYVEFMTAELAKMA